MKAALLAVVGVFGMFLLIASVGSAPALESIMLDRVDIGTSVSENGHGLVGWGPIETDTHGGGWGNLDSGGYPDYTSADKKARVVWYSDFDGSQKGTWMCTPDDSNLDPNGNSAEVTVNPKPGSAHTLKMRVLKGIGDDSFKVHVLHANGELVEVYSFTDGVLWETEMWIEHTIDLDPFDLALGRPLEIHIEATAGAWAGWCPYGQLAVDWIELWGDGKPR